jgi:hypothetical protein
MEKHEVRGERAHDNAEQQQLQSCRLVSMF